MSDAGNERELLVISPQSNAVEETLVAEAAAITEPGVENDEGTGLLSNTTSVESPENSNAKHTVVKTEKDDPAINRLSNDSAQYLEESAQIIAHKADTVNDGDVEFIVNGATENEQQNMQQISGSAVIGQPGPMVSFYPPQLEGLLDCMQVIMHKHNLRHNVVINESAVARYEVIDETRIILFYVEKESPPLTDKSFRYRMYDKNKQLAVEVYNPLSETCFMCHASWHCLGKYKSQTVIFTPPGQVAGFLRRSHTCLLQEFEILSPQEELLLVMRGGPYDLTLYSPDLETGLGRLAVRGWHGIMHEVKRSSDDIGLTFPLDLDVRIKAVLIGSIFAIVSTWLMKLWL